jgi:FtsP/CotA-like multicopper oxidase with cupredoxin domain
VRSDLLAASCSKLLESITFMILHEPIQDHRDRCGGLITCAYPIAAKKWPFFSPSGRPAASGHIRPKMVRIDLMAKRNFGPNRRELMAGFGAAALAAAVPAIAAQPSQPLTLRTRPGSLALRPGQAETPIWAVEGPTPAAGLRFGRGDQLEVMFGNELPVPVSLYWRGIEGVPAAEPLVARAALAAGAKETFQLPLRQAGTFLCDPRLLGDGQARPVRPLAVVVGEREPVAVDSDEVLLIEDWRLRSDGTAIAPGTDPNDTTTLYTVNGRISFDITAHSNQRLRLRFINGCQRAIIALKIGDHEVRVMALDGQPAEPFPARNGALVLAPGGRVDTFIDATAPPGSSSEILLHDGKGPRPIARLVTSKEPALRAAPLPQASALPSNGLPAQLDLKNAVRADLTLGASPSDWVTPQRFLTSSAPAFRARPGRAVVLALINRSDIATVFHLHGHHFRLLDRLDDGWKPFWLDTLAIEPGQPQRVAFLAEHAGRWLVEAFATDWAAPRLVRWYAVE